MRLDRFGDAGVTAPALLFGQRSIVGLDLQRIRKPSGRESKGMPKSVRRLG
jgi:hypothetical protein